MRITARSNKKDMEGIPLALDAERSPMLELLVIGNLECTNVLQHSIPTVDDSPIFSRQYRFSPVHEEEITRQVDELLKSKIIKPTKSPDNTPVWIIPKKNLILKEK